MRKALILTVVALLGSESLAKFRPNVDVRSFDDAQDNEMALNLNYQGAVRDAIKLGNNDYRVKVGKWDDDAQDSEMFMSNGGSFGGRGTFGGNTVLINRPTGGRMGMMDDFEDDTLFTQADLGRMSGPFLPKSGIVGGGGSAPGGVAMGGTGQLNLNIGKNTQLITGLSASHAPGSRVNFAPHVGVNFKFDDESDELFLQNEDDQLFAEDDELFTQGDMGRMSSPFGSGRSGAAFGGGSAPGGVAWGGAAQYAHNIGKNTQLIGGASLSHAPGSRVGINPHVGVRFGFDDAVEDN